MYRVLMDLDLIKREGIEAAYSGGGILRSYLGKISQIRKKQGFHDLVTEADLASERVVIDRIRTQFPNHAILAEESGVNTGNESCQWIIDPLDGTTNYAHQLPIFSVSIGFRFEGNVILGIVLNPVTEELFTGVAGQGAQLNGLPIRVSGTESLAESLLVTGFPYNFKEFFDPLLTRFCNCLKAAQGVRRLGSAALDLCFVAAGRFDGFWEQNLKPWDTAAGLIIAKEAGASVTDFSNQPFTPEKTEILATNGKIHNELLSLLTS